METITAIHMILLSAGDTAAGIVTNNWHENRGYLVRFFPGKKKLSSSPECPSQLWGSTNLLFNVHREHFSLGKGRRGVKLTAYLYLSASLRMSV